MKCLVYGIYILEVVQSALVTENRFRKCVIGLGDVQVFNRVEEEWFTGPTLAAIGELSRTEYEQLMSSTSPRYILCPGILCASDPHFGTIKESRRNNYCCKSSKQVYYI
jgi:hypothetical protein